MRLRIIVVYLCGALGSENEKRKELRLRGTNYNNNNNGRFPRGVRKEEIQQGGRIAHGQELMRPTILCCGEKKLRLIVIS